MIDHFGITVSDISRSKKFYLRALAPLGHVLCIDRANTVSFGVLNKGAENADPGGEFWLSAGNPMVPRLHFAFCAVSREAVDAFFQAGLVAGAVDNGAPGLRVGYHPDYYAAFLIDPDGYNIEAVCHRK
ncbi:MAG: VOC family protein [Paracoccaceae bacterium]